jgi:hypothetical protein
MSDLFAELGSFRFPDTRMNQGPLPSVAGGPAGSNGTPDSRINATNALLGKITPYAYGKAARMGSDRNYQQVAHRAQQIVQQVALPDPHGSSYVHVPHVVDNGELAFVILTGRSIFSSPYHMTNRNNPPTISQFANLDVVNYILCCLQLDSNRTAVARDNLWHRVFQELTTGQLYRGRSYYAYWTDNAAMGLNTAAGIAARIEFYFNLASYLISSVFIPFGVCAGSEKQGGQHEGGYAPVQSAVNYVTTMTVDGQNRDLMNYWHARTINAGDRLILALAFDTSNVLGSTKQFSLNSYYKKRVTQSVPVSNTNNCWPAMTSVHGPPRISSGIGEPAPHTAICKPSGKSWIGLLPIRLAAKRLATNRVTGSLKAYKLPASRAMTTRSDPIFPIRIFKLQKFWPSEHRSLVAKARCISIEAEWLQLL